MKARLETNKKRTKKQQNTLKRGEKYSKKR